MKTQETCLHGIRRSGSTINIGFVLLLAVLGWPDAADAQVQAQPVWVATNGSGSARLNAMTLDRSGNVIVAGYDAGDYLTARFAPNGNLLWSARAAGHLNDFGPNYGVTALSVDAGGNVYVTGGLNGSRSYDTEICSFEACFTYRVNASDQVTIKYNSNGQRQWTATYSKRGENSFVSQGIAVDGAGNVYVTGWEGHAHTHVLPSFTTIKYDATGNQLWIKTNLGARTLLLDSATNVCLTGYNGTQKLDRDGNQLWALPLSGSVLKLDGEGNLYVSTTDTGSVVTKLDPNGTIVWRAPFTGRLALDKSGSVYVAGLTVKLDHEGKRIWQASEYSFTVAAEDSGNVYFLGTDSLGFALRRYNRDGIRLWQTRLSASYDASMTLDSAGDIYIASGNVLTKYRQRAMLAAPVILPDGRLRGGLTGTAGVGYTIEASSDLVNWVPLTNVVLNSAGAAEFTDITLPGPHQRFYRAMEP